GDRVLRPSLGRRRPHRRTAAASAARLLRVGDHDDHVRVPPFRRRRSAGADHPALVLERPGLGLHDSSALTSWASSSWITVAAAGEAVVGAFSAATTTAVPLIFRFTRPAMRS